MLNLPFHKYYHTSMTRTTKFFTIVATLIAAGFLVLATTSNASFATGTNTNTGGGTTAGATSSISQSNTQTATCTAGTSNSFSCNQLAANVNFGNAVSAAIASSSR